MLSLYSLVCVGPGRKPKLNPNCGFLMHRLYFLIFKSPEDGAAIDKEYNEEPVFDRESDYFCPFSHPDYLDVLRNSTTPEIGTPPIPYPQFIPLRPKRSIQFKTKYVDHSGNVLSYSSGQPQIRVDATVHVSDYALTLVSQNYCTLKWLTSLVIG